MSDLLAWFVRNRVAANLLMGLLLFGGLLSLGSVRKEVFPEFSTEIISVSVRYPGASPEETEEAVCARIEERLFGLESTKRLRSVAAEGLGTVFVEFLPDTDLRYALDDVKARIDTIDSFPEDAEEPLIQELVPRVQVLSVAISGHADELSLKYLGEKIRDDLLALPDVTQVEFIGVRPYEISIEVSEESLRRYGLNFDDIAEAVRRSSLDLPGGTLRTDSGELILRTEGQSYSKRHFEELTLLSRSDGTHLRLGHVTTVRDGFAEVNQAIRFDGEPAVLLQVFRVADQDALQIARQVKEFVRRSTPTLPHGVKITVWQDESKMLRERLATLLANGRDGLILVFIVLMVFLELRLAGYVALGIPVCFLSALWLMPVFELSINVPSLFAFILVLGIVVDDAIVVGENVYRHYGMGYTGEEAAIRGVQEVAVPVFFSVLTTIVAFVPLTNIPGNIGKFLKVIPLVVIITLIFSLVESLFILPAHLVLPKRQNSLSTLSIADSLERHRARFMTRIFLPALRRIIRWRYTAVAAALLSFFVTTGLVLGGHLKFMFFPPVEANNVVFFLTMPQGTLASETSRVLRHFENAASELSTSLSQEGYSDDIRHILTSIGSQPFRETHRSDFGAGADFSGAHLGEINIELASAEERQIRSQEIAKRWREFAGPVPDAVEAGFNASLALPGKSIDIQLAGPYLEELKRAANELKKRLGEYPGVANLADSFHLGKTEVLVDVTEEAESHGLSRSDLARQVRQAFYGEEVQRLQRDREELKIMVRYPARERRSLANLEEMWVRTPDGTYLPFALAGQLDFRRGFAAIERTDGRRTVNITADVDPSEANANEILLDVRTKILPNMMSQYRGISYRLEGEQQEQRDTFSGLRYNMIWAFFIIYSLIAIPLRSYIQPLIVIAAVPFGFVGAVWGHVLLGHTLTVNSAIGIVAVAGVVINDSLIFVDFVNRRRSDGTDLLEALTDAAEKRFRPIVLTSITTFVGLLPLLLEKSLQAQFLIPMATSIAFGVALTTVVVPVLVPAIYMIMDDLSEIGRRWFFRQSPASASKGVAT